VNLSLNSNRDIGLKKILFGRLTRKRDGERIAVSSRLNLPGLEVHAQCQLQVAALDRCRTDGACVGIGCARTRRTPSELLGKPKLA